MTTNEPTKADSLRRKKAMEDISDWGKYKFGRFEDYVEPEACRDPNHNPPSLMVVPYGKIYRHKCPECGCETVIKPSCNYDMVRGQVRGWS